MSNINNYSLSEISTILGISERRVQQLVKGNIISKSSKDKYDLENSVKGYIKYLKTGACNIDPDSSNIDVNEEKGRLIKARAEKAELELELLKGKYLEKKEVDFTWENLMLYFRGRILAMPTKLAPTIVTACSDKSYSAGCHKVHDILEEELRQALLELSKTEYDDIAPEEDITYGEDAATDGEVIEENEG